MLKAQPSSQTVSTFAIEGMTCGACVSAISNAIENLDGVSNISISLVTERGVIEHDANKISVDQLLRQIDDCGFDARILETKHRAGGTHSATYAIEGMTCGACVASITNALQDQPGVVNPAISLVTERGAVEFDPAIVTAEEIRERIEECGFDAKQLSVHSVGANAESAPTPDENYTTEIRLRIYGMTCASCSSSIESALLAVPGVKDAMISLATEEATVIYTPALVGPRDIVQTIDDAGFDAIMASSADNSLQLESLSRVKEISKNRRDLIISLILGIPVIAITKLVPGVLPFLGFLKTPIIPGLYIDDVLNCALTIPIQFGVGRKFYKSSLKAIKHRALTMDVLVCLSTSCAFFFSILSIFFAICSSYSKHPATLWETSAMLITFITAGKYIENKAKGQTSVALSRLISLSPSTATIYTNPEKYQESRKAHSFDSSALTQKTIATDLLQEGDIIVLLPGEKISADGIVLTGESYADESLITGESMPVSKKPGDSVICGSINGLGRLDVEVKRVGNDTHLAHIVQLVQDAQTSKTRVQRYADYVAGIFVPVVLFLAFTTFLIWMVLSHVLNKPPHVFDGEEGKLMVCLRMCISVIVVACPCALGLATPTAVMVGTGVGAENGILIKGGAVLETASRVTTVLFDKTGTLTTGKMAVRKVQRLTTIGTNLVLKPSAWWTLVAAVEQNSEHPVARGIVARARVECRMQTESNDPFAEQPSPFEAAVSDFNVVVGRGVTATVMLPSENTIYNVVTGNMRLLESMNIEFPQEVLEKSAVAGQTLVFVAINKAYAGYIELADEVRPQARATVDALKKLGYSVGIVSGDLPPVVERVAKEVGIPSSMCYGGVSPEGKLQIVEALESNDIESGITYYEGSTHRAEVVGFVGDGINDSPALAHASLGISLAGATDAAMEAADIVLIKEDPLLDVAAAFHLSRATFRRIKLNLCWAVVYNLFMIPIAMGVFLPIGIMLHPVFAGAAMAFSSVSVVISSLMLQFWKRPSWMDTKYVKDSWWTRLKSMFSRSSPTYERLDN